MRLYLQGKVSLWRRWRIGPCTEKSKLSQYFEFVVQAVAGYEYIRAFSGLCDQCQDRLQVVATLQGWGRRGSRRPLVENLSRSCPTLPEMEQKSSACGAKVRPVPVTAAHRTFYVATLECVGRVCGPTKCLSSTSHVSPPTAVRHSRGIAQAQTTLIAPLLLP
jgi:hypothetical protein